MDIEKAFKIVLDCSFKIHSELGPGLLESVYEHCLFHELTKSGLVVYQQKPVPLVYKEVKLETGYRIDLYVENKIVIEVKSIEALANIHLAQVLTYLRLSESKLGLLVNFNVLHLKDGIKRVIL
ncbi:MAG: GxxExxY protein [Bacteroidetes bacterium]|nr:GxxExxY protein [Bacteroidota bacterium]MCK5766190.1 GxxExxY protein [Bacteroidales bacterium]